MSRHFHHSHIKKKDLYKAIFAVLLIAVLLVVAVLLINKWENRQFAVSLDGTAAPTQAAQAGLTVDGITYLPKQQIRTYLFLGIDVSGPAKEIESYIGGGQADVQMVLVVDDEAKTWQLLQLNRDTITEIPVLGVTGQVVGTVNQQLALAHSYGKGMKDSCQNNVTAVSNLLQGQKIDGYLSLNMDGVAILNDSIGGVPVEITADFSAVDDSLPLGETVTLQGEQALTFLRNRKDVDDETNLSRMARQRQYLSSLFNCLAKQEEATILNAYDAAADYIVTDLGSQTIVDLVRQLKDYTRLELLTIDGTSYLDDEGCRAYDLDAESLQDVILQLFYST